MGDVLKGSRALLALEKQLHAAQTALDLSDPRDHAHRVEDFGRRLVGVVALRHGEDQPVALESGLDGAQGAGPAGGYGGREAGEDDRPPERENRKRLTLTHDGSW